MPPKKKGGGGKKGKRTDKGEKQPQLTVRESILGFQIEVKERDLKKLTEEFRVLKDKNRKLRYRNEQLKKEQEEHIKNLLKQSKENEKEVEQMTVVKQDEVEKALMDKIQIIKGLVIERDEIKEEIEDLVRQLQETNKAISLRNDYKNEGQVIHEHQISILKKKLSDMDGSFQEVSAHLDHSLKIAQEEIEQQAQSALTIQEKVALEEAANSINNNDRQEIADHNWLKKEINIHATAFEDMSVIVAALERENLEIMQELFDCRVKDLNLTRHFYLACIDDENSGKEEVFAEHGVMSIEKEDLHDEKLLENYYNFDDEDYLHSAGLGLMDSQLLTLVGTKMVIHEKTRSQLQLINASHEAGGTNLEKTDSENYIWPISESMLRTLAIK